MPLVSYSDALADRICAELARGRSLRDICRDDDMPNRSTVRDWVVLNEGGFGDRYRALPRRRGNPSTYTRAWADRFCAELREGRSRDSICRDPGMPTVKSVTSWLKADHDGFAARYREAREIGFVAMADEILDIADNLQDDYVVRVPGGKPVFVRESVMRSRVRIAARTWILSKLMPRALGKTDVLGLGSAGGEVRDTLAEVMREIDERNRELGREEVEPEVTTPEPQRCASCGARLR